MAQTSEPSITVKNYGVSPKKSLYYTVFQSMLKVQECVIFKNIIFNYCKMFYNTDISMVVKSFTTVNSFMV